MMQVTSFIRKYHICMASLLVDLCVNSHSCNVAPSLLRLTTTCDRWKCPRNSLECINESDLDWIGWLVFAILTVAHTAGDIINGLKLLLLCGKRRHDNGTRARFFIAGLCLTFVSTFTVYTSTVYNSAIAR
jgi:hypothetical protein